MGFDFRNTNTLWASVLVETLVRLGLKTAVVSPGSRSTPLTVALAAHSEVEAIPILDERSAAFFALGLAKRSGLPTLLLCTSGTAGANYYPAIIEARESRVPLLVITADRPPQLRHCGSGQTIDQQKLFGDFPNWYAELALPRPQLPLLAYLRQTLVQAWRRTLGPSPGPVHLNCPLEDPLAPVEDNSVEGLRDCLDHRFWLGLEANPETSSRVAVTDLSWLLNWLVARSSCDRGLIIAGPAQEQDPLAYSQAIASLSTYLQWPVLAEALSPLRNHAQLQPYLITTYDLILRSPHWARELQPDQLLQVGPLPTSKVLRQWLEHSPAQRWLLDSGIDNLDPLHGHTTALSTSLPAIALALAQETSPPQCSGLYLERWLSLEQQSRQQLDQGLEAITDLFSGKVPWLMAQVLPPRTPLVIANSLPIREAEWFWPPGNRGLRP
ncbi:MAG: 2-succinyl-5-enolpyruvyl-6-hydroxy-3-cyclohexene-1-carboxylic-acid synthase, partial [Nodosilinea sp.]